MPLCLNNPVLGRNTTAHFTPDPATKQLVPKKGTDSVAGALALNLGTAPGDDTNEEDGLTASGFIALATQVDSTAPLCGNALQQSVVKALARSIACNPAAQKALGCSIASNPAAVACLAAAL